MTVLHEAVKGGDRGAAYELLNYGDVEVDDFDDKGVTALYIACEENYMDIAQLLMQAGADVEGGFEVGGSRTPLYAAAKEGHADLVALLLRYGANPDLTGNGDYPPLYYAKNGAIVRLLLDAGAQTYQDGYSWEVLHQAAKDGVEAL